MSPSLDLCVLSQWFPHNFLQVELLGQSVWTFQRLSRLPKCLKKDWTNLHPLGCPTVGLKPCFCALCLMMIILIPLSLVCTSYLCKEVTHWGLHSFKTICHISMGDSQRPTSCIFITKIASKCFSYSLPLHPLGPTVSPFSPRVSTSWQWHQGWLTDHATHRYLGANNLPNSKTWSPGTYRALNSFHKKYTLSIFLNSQSLTWEASWNLFELLVLYLGGVECVHTQGCQRPTSAVFLNCCPHCFIDRLSHWTKLELASLGRLTNRQDPGILLPLPPCWDYRHVLLCPTFM